MQRRHSLMRSKLNARERGVFREMADDVFDLRHNWERRLKNALSCLTQCDPQWMVWVEREIDMEEMSFQEITRLIEARARLIVLKPYGYFGRKVIGDFIFREDWAFTDRGNLGPG